MKVGQIAHLDQNAFNNASENLASLCFVHHDEYDSTMRQSKNYTAYKIKAFRTELVTALEGAFAQPVKFGEVVGAVRRSSMIDGRYIRLEDSELDTFATKFPHQRRALVIGTSPIGHRMHEFSAVAEDVSAEVGQPVRLRTPISHVAQAHRHVVIGIRTSITARAGAEQHHAIKSTAIYCAQRVAKRASTGSSISLLGAMTYTLGANRRSRDPPNTP
jgi:hypothetical protein